MTAHDIGVPADFVDGAARRIEVAGQRVAVVRIGEALYAIGDRCSHADYSLSEGDVIVADRELECWKHGSAFSLVTGQPGSLPATTPVPVYAIRVEGGRVVLEVEEAP